MSETVHLEGLTISLPSVLGRTRTTDEAGDVTFRYFIHPTIVLAINVESNPDSRVLRLAPMLARGVLENYSSMPGYMVLTERECAVAGASSAFRVSFEWTSDTGQRQTSVLVTAANRARWAIAHFSMPQDWASVGLAEVEHVISSIELSH